MSFNVVGYVEAHPWTVGALAVGGIAAFVVVRKAIAAGSSGSSVVVAGSSGPDDAQLADSTNLSLAQISAGVATNQTNAELQAAQLSSSLQGTIAGLQAQLGMAQTQAGEDVANNTLSTQLAALLDQDKTSVALNTDNNQTTLGLSTIQASVANNQIAANEDIVTSLVAALTPAPAATPAPIPTVTQVTTAAPTTNIWDQYLIDNPDVAAWAASGHGDPSQPIASQSLEQRAAYQYYNTGESEGRTLDTGTQAA